MLIHRISAIVAVAMGIGGGVWYANRPPGGPLLAIDDLATKAAWALRDLFGKSAAQLDDSLLSLTQDELKLKELPSGYRYQSLPYPLPANWDDGADGQCEIYRWARTIPNPKLQSYFETDTTVDGMYGQFLSRIRPPTSDSSVAKEAFDAYLGSRKSLEAIERQVRRDRGREAAREWTALRTDAEKKYLELARVLQSSLNNAAGTYAQALLSYANDAHRESVACGALAGRFHRFSIQPSLAQFREEQATRTSLVARAELVSFAPGTSTDNRSDATKLGDGQIDLSFRRARVFSITPGGWYTPAALREFSDKLKDDSNGFWGDNGLFPLMPVALLAVTEPTLKVRLSPEQAAKVQEVLAGRRALQIGSFQFDFSTTGRYRVAAQDDGGATEIEFSAPRNEVVILGVISKRPNLSQ